MGSVQRFTTLDSFRGVFALLVVFHHLHVVGAFIELPFFRRAEILLNFFFVLSGFVLAHSYGLKAPFGFKRFVISRIFRLYPLHVVMLLVFILFEGVRWAAYKKGFTLNNVPFTGLFDPSEILPNLLLVQAWTTLTETMSFNYPSWSISIEFYIYLLFGALCLLSLKSRFVMFACVAIVAFTMIFTEHEPLVWRAMMGLSCFFAGNITYLAYLLIRDRFVPVCWLMTVLEVGLTCTTYWMVMNDYSDRSPIASLTFCVLVLVFAFEAGLVSTFLKTAVFRLLGKLSYSIYMTHAALLFCLSTVFIVAQKLTGRDLSPMINGQRFMDTGSELANNALVIAVTLVAIGLAALAHTYIELKGVELGKRMVGQSPSKAPVSQGMGDGLKPQVDRAA
ncbi:acyltransferase family protein [Pseudomonas graminis]|uniref:Peptidoglycan/LPS O-acetylase OafA/YrhL, contains acyltransferase and SGNH-hydrolase domains n=1 Tax=Pseudomonas graminis TaxID=158627 RepID=A0A1I0DSG4_9PSED|nr:acyltransferase [Pseudomonas graminis]SET35520.1 Peptidoglycan/LPS O-acetylase OafA/YrhL, contains acyltransferase and SGNH-hydrolase domains [Pseudomonas graminis]